MLQDFTDRVAVVTGAASGIGAALCEAFAALGMRVVAGDIDGDGARRTAEALPSAIGRAVDVSDAAAVSEFADAAFAEWGQVDVLVNNAGVFQGGLMWERTEADWAWTFGVNVHGILHAVRSFVPRMIAQGTDGHIVNTASVAAFVAGAASSPYVVSKCAAFSISECLALDLGVVGSRIGVSVLTPSAIDTAIAGTARVRPDRYGVDESPDGKMTVDALTAMTSTGLPPSAAAAPVIEAIRTGEFLIPTRPSYRDQLSVRYEALLERRLPPRAVVD